MQPQIIYVSYLKHGYEGPEEAVKISPVANPSSICHFTKLASKQIHPQNTRKYYKNNNLLNLMIFM